MRKFLKRLIAAEIGVVLAFAAIAPIQAQRFLNAYCAGDVAGIYEFVKNIGFSYERVEFIEAMAAGRGGRDCSKAGVIGAIVPEGSLVIVTNGDEGFFSTNIFLMQFDWAGQLEKFR